MSDSSLVKANLPRFQEAYRNAYKAYKFIIYDAEQALDQVLAGSAASQLLIPRYLNWCQKELNSSRSDIESRVYDNCQTYKLLEIENSLKTLIEAFQKQQQKLESCNFNGTDNVDQNVGDDDMLIDSYTRMNIE